jgi:hypothetical protein
MIYFIQDTETRRIKIGVSAEPAQRLKQLQTAHASELKLIAVMDGARNEEQALHQIFTRKRGEWFEPTRDLLAFIKEKAVSVASVTNGRRHRRSIVSEWEPELQGNGYFQGMARLVHHILADGKGPIEELAAMMYPGHDQMHAHDPVTYPEMSLLEFQNELQRLVDIQNT